MKWKIGVIGYSGQKFDEKQARAFLRKGLEMLEHEGVTNVVVSGYTNMGIPRLAYQVGETLGFRTMGLSAKAALKYDLYPVDEEVKIVGEEFGDESGAFLAYIDCLLKVGGGEQSEREFELFRKMYPEKEAIDYRLDAES